jgi:hypothetical protein
LSKSEQSKRETVFLRPKVLSYVFLWPALFSLLLSFGLPPSAFGDPSWWYSRGVVSSNAIVGDYSPLILGQLKWMATNACNELDYMLPDGAGAAVWSTVQGFSVPTNNWLTVNVGQLKYVAKPFYDRLIEVECKTDYPWTGTTNDDADYAIANIGQMKNVFSFDLIADGNTNGMPDLWEMKHFGNLNQTASGDYDNDGLTNLEEWQHGANPTQTDTDNDGMPDGWEVTNAFDPVNAGDASSDADGDGLNNLEEYEHGANPHASDTDGDGLGDASEVAARTDPNNSDTNKPTVTITFPANNLNWVGMP